MVRGTIEVRLSGSSRRARRLWDAGNEALRRWFHPVELAALAGRRNRDAATAARLLAKRAVRRALRRAGLRQIQAPCECAIALDLNGRPWVDLPAETVRWLARSRLGLDVSMAHAGERVCAAAVLA